MGRQKSLNGRRNIQFANTAIMDDSEKLTIHRIVEKMRTKYRREVGDFYVVLPLFLYSYSDVNLEAVLALQVDNEDSFMRLFVTIPRFNELISLGLLLLLLLLLSCDRQEQEERCSFRGHDDGE